LKPSRSKHVIEKRRETGGEVPKAGGGGGKGE